MALSFLKHRWDVRGVFTKWMRLTRHGLFCSRPSATARSLGRCVLSKPDQPQYLGGSTSDVLFTGRHAELRSVGCSPPTVSLPTPPPPPPPHFLPDQEIKGQQKAVTDSASSFSLSDMLTNVLSGSAAQPPTAPQQPQAVSQAQRSTASHGSGRGSGSRGKKRHS